MFKYLLKLENLRLNVLTRVVSISFLHGERHSSAVFGSVFILRFFSPDVQFEASAAI